MIEHHFLCPYCWQGVSVLLDNSIARQSYIEDCEVCCNPIQFEMRFEDLELTDFHVAPIGQ
ncbi:CPXCG motif-containing cysteine-rich protein [Aestuariivivens sediminicola]|uniref:CPXCG motif-containing cysteine-rich protein n=1 Tax=Aestuariivivens sediminicola TaxID=2913560 RepID=UPI001F57BBE1|nr:CPXCG motif-containing cysteine-rich protein [Aestuariivivens sediminicola]